MGVSSIFLMLLSGAVTLTSAVILVSVAVGLFTFSSGYVNQILFNKLLHRQVILMEIKYSEIYRPRYKVSGPFYSQIHCYKY